jgi:antitoxin MazE
MKTKLVKIGNSNGLVISKAIIEQVKLTEEVELTVTKDGLLISPIASKRKGWDAQFKKANKKGDKLILGDINNEFDKNEWTW